MRDSALATLEPFVDTSSFKQPVLVANTLGFRRQEIVELPNGTLASVDVPPFGYVVVEKNDGFLRTTDQPVKAVQSRQGITMENGLLRVKINAKGYIASIFDLRVPREVLSEPANVFHLHRDIPDRWDAWDVDIYYKERCEVVEGLEKLELVESSPLRGVVRIVRAFGKSRIEQHLILNAGSARIDFPTEVDWKESQKLLKVAFPVDIYAQKATYEIQFGHLERATHANTSWDMGKFEVCAQKWADLSETGYGVALLNDCKYGHDIQGNVMRLSLLRAPVSPDPLADRGRHSFTYAVLPHIGDLRDGHVIEQAYGLNVPLIVRDLKTAAGRLPASHSFFLSSRRGAIVETIKVAEDGGAIVVRLYEAEGGRGPHDPHYHPAGAKGLAHQFTRGRGKAAPD